MASIDLTDIATLKGWLQVANAGDDIILASLITRASAAFLAAINRPALAVAEYTEQRDGNGSRRLLLRNYPITAVSSVTINGHALLPSADGWQRGYVFDDFGLTLVGAHFAFGASNVGVSYSAGYEVVPADIEQAVIAIAATWYKRRGWIDQASKSIQGEVVAFRSWDIPPEALATVENYKRRIPV